ncbi:CC/Se motif family (seleno)protein [Helicovermis profundi]|uniref:FeS cluster biogenesis domain-containing protein n=1 Tax=Helicovermis profundi TaxID=3065157 RepID=A0AAU9E5V6_9FIRM|nr:hypothetical protein HLPR_10690 [Clostridia bacterium S502]
MTKNIKINLEKDVIDFMRKKNRTELTLTVRISGGGCCETFEISEIDLNKPSNIDLYNVFKIDDIDIYISKNTKISTPLLNFKLEKSLFSKNIIAVGVLLKKH